MHRIQIAFDTGPGNALLDIAVTQVLPQGALTYDRGGHLRQAGQG